MITNTDNSIPESQIHRSNTYSDEYLKFKIYKNVKSRALPEEELRDKFSGNMDYLLYCFSLTGSLANLTRFSYLAYSYNGCTFLVQFLILVVLIGIPWCFIETTLGQYSGRGPTILGDMVPIGKGVAVAMGYICLLNIVCYSPIQSRCLLYMYTILIKEDIPWKDCSFANKSRCIDDFKNLMNTDSNSVGIELRVPVESYYLFKIVSMDQNVLYDGLGNLYLPLLFCLVFSWIVNFTFLTTSNNFKKYVQLFGCIAPFPVLFGILFVIMMNKHAWGGFYTLIDINTINLLDTQSWRRAAEQVLYSLDVGTGHLFIYGLKCDFRNNILKNILVVTMLNTICAVTATFIVFGTANIIACKFHISFYSVFISGPGMFFIAVSHAVKDLPFPEVLTLWSFFVLFVICILTQHSYLKPVIYLLKTYLKQYNIKSPDNLPNIVCATMFGLSLVTVTNGGEMLISLVDDIGSAMGILMITTFEAILIFGIYGMNEFCADLAFMTNNSPSIALKLLFIGGPVFIIHIIFASSLNWISPSFQNVTYPPMMYWVAWSLAMITLLILMSFAAHTIIQFIKIKDFYGSFEPTERWVPDLFHSLNQLESMAVVRKEVEYNTGNHLTFGVGRPKLCIKVDNATQTNIHHQTGNEHQNVISNQRQKHYYLEVFNGSCNDYQLERKHNENEVIIWNHSLLLEHSLDYGILEKYVQTD